MLINLVIAFGLRLVLSFIPGLSFDMGAWFGWAERLTTLPWGEFYSKTIWTNYTPGYFYVLYLLRRFELLLKSLFLFELSGIGREVLFKLPANLADIGTGILIYQLLKKKSRKIAVLASAFYLFNPAIIFNSSVWGQTDSVMAFLALLAVYLLLNKKTLLASFSYGFAFLVKPQSLFLAPLFFFLLVRQNIKKDYLKFGLIFLLTVLVLSWPFFPRDPFLGIWKMIFQMGRDYPHTTLNAFNFWYLLGNWQSDQSLLLGSPKYYWGLGIFLFFELLLILKVFWKKKLLKKKENIFLLASLLLLNFYLFPTRVHERYLFPFFAFFVIAVFSWRSLKLVPFYIFLSLAHFANLYYVYSSYQESILKIDFLYNLMTNLAPLLSLLTLALFGYLLFVFWGKLGFFFEFADWVMKKPLIEPASLSRKKIKPFAWQNQLLALVLFFSLLVRFWHLNYPADFYFDEVYHAFTATEMAKGNVAAWEWWNTPPEGMAYEWTHPPLAKLLMTAGIFLFGETAFGWRSFGALLGAGCVLLIYLLGKKLFDQKVALFASFLFAFDGLPLVMSRIGMNDIYFLFFALLALWFFLERQHLLAGLAFGLSLSSKWTAVYLLPVLGAWQFLIWLKQKKKKRFSFLRRSFLIFVFCFFLLPIAIYFFSYLAFFATNHSLEQWWELQHQMWWYHTGLEATHNYQSSALSWPILKRPVWFFVDYAKDAIANVYAMGNPFIWWGGLISLPLAIWQAIEKRNQQLGLVIFAYLAFFLPWVFSPRIMFVYHYLPSVAFLCLFLGWTLGRFWEEKLTISHARFKRFFRKRKVVVKHWLIGYLVLVLLVFLFFYPHWTAIHVPKALNKLYFWFPLWQ